jgi:hypothetical protein
MSKENKEEITDYSYDDFAPNTFVESTYPLNGSTEEPEVTSSERKRKEMDAAYELFKEKFVKKTKRTIRSCEVLSERLTKQLQQMTEPDEVQILDDVYKFVLQEEARLIKKIHVYENFLRNFYE